LLGAALHAALDRRADDLAPDSPNSMVTVPDQDLTRHRDEECTSTRASSSCTLSWLADPLVHIRCSASLLIHSYLRGTTCFAFLLVAPPVVIRLSPTAARNCAFNSPPPRAEAKREANCLPMREEMQRFTPSLLEGKQQERWASNAWQWSVWRRLDGAGGIGEKQKWRGPSVGLTMRDPGGRGEEGALAQGGGSSGDAAMNSPTAESMTDTRRPSPATTAPPPNRGGRLSPPPRPTVRRLPLVAFASTHREETA
jgi:hypothetical protein